MQLKTMVINHLRVSIAIPAYNEERNIGNLLRDTLETEADWFCLQDIYVISDASDDKTDEIVLQEAKRDNRIKLVRKPKRQGKWDSLNLAISLCDADVLVLLDADVKLADKKVLRNLLIPFLGDDIALVGGNPIPIKPGITLNVAEQAAYFGWILVNEIKKRKPISLYSAHGRILALSRNFFQHLILPNSPADDQYIYFSCIKDGLNFAYVEDSVVYYTLPGNLGDYLKQSVRFRFNTDISKKMFGKGLVEREARIPNGLALFFSAFVSHPYSGLMWTICSLIGKIKFLTKRLLKKDVPAMWDVAKTAK